VAIWRNPLAAVRSTTVGILGLTILWTGFQIFDSNPPPILDQILVAAFGVWFATEARRNNAKTDAAEEPED
jgi:hypothetical protein